MSFLLSFLSPRCLQGRSSGINFALPIDKVLDVAPKLIVYGNAMGKRV